MTRTCPLLPMCLLISTALACGGSPPAGPGPMQPGGPGKPGSAGTGGSGMTGMPHPGDPQGTGSTAGGAGATGMKGSGGTPGSGGAKGTGGATGMAGMTGKGMQGQGGPGQGGMNMPGKMPPMGMGTGGVIIIGIPAPGTPGTVFPGGGPSGSAPLAPGCTPASAHECPSSSGVCATSSTSMPTGTTMGSICFYGPITSSTTTTQSSPAATIEYLHETAGGEEYYRFRVTFDPRFVDNTYGANAIGWGQRGHTFNDLVGSDHAELALFDGGLGLVSQFDIDYISQDSAATCAYGALGVSGGEGKMLIGDSKYVLASTTSLDRDLNGCGYCKSAACGGDCTNASPATDSSYTPNSSAPNWDYRVVYEVWMDASVFGSAGFGGASISFVHASPSKANSDTVTVVPKPCGGCPEGSESVMTSEGLTCVPVCPAGGGTGGSSGTSGTGGSGSTGETGFYNYSESSSNGEMGAPANQCPVCPDGERAVTYTEGYSCVPGCSTGTIAIEGGECVPVCPDGVTPDTTGDGANCSTSTGF